MVIAAAASPTLNDPTNSSWSLHLRIPVFLATLMVTLECPSFTHGLPAGP